MSVWRCAFCEWEGFFCFDYLGTYLPWTFEADMWEWDVCGEVGRGGDGMFVERICISS